MKSNARFVRGAVIVSLVLAAVLVAGIGGYMTKRPQMLHAETCTAAANGEYEQAAESLSRLRECGNDALYYETVLTIAETADVNGDFDIALELLAVPVESEDEVYTDFVAKANALAEVCTYHQAQALFEAGEYAKAARMAASVREYEPALELYQQAERAYQADQPTPAPTPVPTPVPVATEQPATTDAGTIRLWMPDRLATGFAHTVVLLDDGTVCAFGDNTYGQTEVSEWKNVVAVAAGAYHTLGLTADGRVLACGDNTYEQTDTALFGGVQAIAAGDYDSFLILSTGEVFSVGFHSYGFLQELSQAQQLWAGSYGLIVQTPEGLHGSHASLALDARCVTASLSRGYAIGVDTQGNTCATTSLLPQWTNVAAVAAGENAALALTKEGAVLAHVFDKNSRADFAFDQPVLAMSASANHYAFVLADGTLDIRYANGQTEQIALP